MNKYKHKIPREDLKRFAKEIAKKLVASDYKAGRVTDPTKIEDRQVKKVKEYCKQFFDKAYQKHKKHETEKAARDKNKKPKAREDASATSAARSPAGSPKAEEDDDDVDMSEDEDIQPTPSVDTPPGMNGTGTLKRKRTDQVDDNVASQEEDQESMGSPSKRLNLEIGTPPPPPPPPPAPPMETPPASTPHEGDDVDMEIDTDIHADTNFKGKSMADVLAQAQAEDVEDDGDKGDIAMKNGDVLGNPVVDEQPVEPNR